MPQRSPIIFALLIAASLGSCGVALSLTAERSRSEYAAIAYFALLGSILSVVCIWSALRPRASFWTRGAPVAATLVVSMAFALDHPDDFLDCLSFFGAQAAILLSALWAFRRSRYWQQRSGMETNWQYSIAQLLVVMTVVALLLVSFQLTNFWQDGDDETAFFFGSIAGSTILAVASASIWSLNRHWLLRLAGVLAVAIGLSVPFYFFTGFGGYLFIFMTFQFLTQAIVMAVWLAWGGILPPRRPAIADNLS